MRRKLRGILKRIEESKSDGGKFDLAFTQTTLPMRETGSFVVESDVVGRKEDKETIVTMLIKNEQHLAFLPIVGVAGIGKTRLAQLIYNDPQVVNHFDLRVWILVSDVWDMEKITTDLTIAITRRKSDLPFRKSLFVQERLVDKRYLIVLDDVCKGDPSEWNNLSRLLNCSDKSGSAIIVTTRSRRVAEITGTLPSYDVPILSESESWTLFSREVFAPGTETPEELAKIGKDIVKNCRGLPLAIRMVGRSLYFTRDVMDWLKMRDSEMFDIIEETKLQLRYKDLPSHTKRCFAFCATFPKDYLIEKEMLIQMWMAHGFIPSGNLFDVQGNEVFAQLVEMSFLHDLKEGKKEYASLYAPETHRDDRHDPFTVTSCKMPHHVHYLAQYIAGDEVFYIVESTSKHVYYLSVGDLGNKEVKREFMNYGTSIQFFYMGEVTENFLEFTFSRFSLSTTFLQHLRYLHLSSVEIRELPDYISTLHHLQTLDLFRCYRLRKLPESICTLFNLRTLNLRGCTSLCELPEKMPHMSGLRNLYLDRCYNLKKMPARMGGMTQLQTLSMYIVSHEDGRGIDELKGLDLSSKLEIYNLRHVKDAEKAREMRLHSKALQWLTLCWREVDYVLPSNYNDAAINYLNQEEVLEELKPPGGINVLKIWNYHGLNFSAWMMTCLHLVQLHLGYCPRIHRLPPFWRMKSLELLSLRRLDNLKYIINDDDDGPEVYRNVLLYPSLRKLRLCSLRRLEDWWENRNAAQVMAICFSSLEELEIEKCPEFAGAIPSFYWVKDLKIKESNKIRLGRTLPNETLGDLEGLQKLSIRKCEDVMLIGRKLISFGSCLNELEIMECDWMFSSRASGFWRCVASLETLTIFECHALVDMFEVLQGLSSLRKLEILVSLIVPEATSTMVACLPPQLEEFSFFSCESMRTLELRCPASLNRLDIWGCPNLVSLTAAEQELGQLTSLTSITLHDCCKLKSLELEMGGGLAALRQLTITDCTALMSLPECMLQRLPSVEQLEIGGCPGLEKKCTSGGEYFHLVSNIPKMSIRKDSAPTHFIVTSRRTR